MCPRLIVQETRVPSCTTVLSLYLHGMLYVVKSRETDEDRRLSGLRMYIGSLSPSLPQLVNHVSAYISHGEKRLVAVTLTRVTATKRNSILWTD